MEKNLEAELIDLSSDSEPEMEFEKIDKTNSDEIEKAKRKSKEDGGDNTTKKSRLNSQSSEEDGTKSLAKNGENEITGKGRAYTVSIAVAGSAMKVQELLRSKVQVAYRLTMAAKDFKVEEIIIFDDSNGAGKADCEQLAKLISFLECPTDIKKAVFKNKFTPDLELAAFVLKSTLDFQHDLKKTQALPFREGVVSSKTGGKDYSLVDVGLEFHCRVSKAISENVGDRVTVKFDDPDPDYILKPKGKLKGTVVPKYLAKKETGLYWGYSVRIASSLGKVFSECPFREGYDVKVGTSAKGSDSRLLQPQPYNHLLVVFGGVEGLEYALENDEGLQEGDVSKLFDHYVNAYPSQGKIPSGNSVGEEFSLSLRAMSRFITK